MEGKGGGKGEGREKGGGEGGEGRKVGEGKCNMWVCLRETEVYPPPLRQQ